MSVIFNPAGSPVYSAAYATSNQTIHTSSFTALTFDTNAFDLGGVHNTLVNPTRFTIPAGFSGKYCSGVSIFITSPNSVAQYILRPLVNGATASRGGLGVIFSPGAGQNMGLNASTLINLSAGDYIEWQIDQTSGVDQTVLNTTDYLRAYAWIYLVSQS